MFGIVNNFLFLTSFAVIALCIIFFIFRNPLIGLILIIMTIPLDGQSIDTGFMTLTPSNFLLIITTLSVFIKRARIPKMPLWLISIWMIYIITGLFGARASSYNIRIFFTLVGAFLFYILLVFLVRKEKDLHHVTVGYGISAFIQVILAWMQILGFYYLGLSWGIHKYSTPGGYQLVRPVGAHFDPNYYGIYLLPIFGVVSAMLFERKTLRGRIGNVILLIFLASGVFISYSRTVWVGAIFILIILSLLYLLERLRVSTYMIHNFIVLVILLAMVVIIFLPVLPFTKIGIVKQLIEMNEPSVFYRYITFKEALDKWAESPLFGYGTGSVTSLYVHNIFLQIMLRAGLFGLIPFIIIVGFAFFGITKSMVTCQNLPWFTRAMIRGYGAGLYMIILSVLLFGFEGHKMIWLICGIATAITLNIKKLGGQCEESQSGLSI